VVSKKTECLIDKKECCMENNENQVPDWIIVCLILIPIGMIYGAYYLWKHWEIFVALLYAAVSFFVVHWFSILAILALWEIVRLLRVMANTHGEIETLKNALSSAMETVKTLMEGIIGREKKIQGLEDALQEERANREVLEFIRCDECRKGLR
jgi:hypothetical protein